MTHHEHDPRSDKGPETKLGKVMLFVAPIVALILLTMLFEDSLEKQENPNQTPNSYRAGGVIEVVLERNKFGHYVTSGTINDYPVVFMLDTGATGVSIPEEVANIIGLEKGHEYSTYTANGIGKGYHTRIDSLAFGEIRVENLNAGIAPKYAWRASVAGDECFKKAGVYPTR